RLRANAANRSRGPAGSSRWMSLQQAALCIARRYASTNDPVLPIVALLDDVEKHVLVQDVEIHGLHGQDDSLIFAVPPDCSTLARGPAGEFCGLRSEVWRCSTEHYAVPSAVAGLLKFRSWSPARFGYSAGCISAIGVQSKPSKS